MSKKRKVDKQEKQKRRQEEALKASKLNLAQLNSKHQNQSTAKNAVSANEMLNDKYRLPIVEIKKDVIKNLIYAFAAVVVVTVLSRLDLVSFLRL